MAGKFGADFNADQPSDADLVKKGAQWLRDIRARIKATWAVCFNLETGQPLDNVFPYSSLKSLNPNPAGSWNRVTVNNKGLVTSGSEEDIELGAKLYRTIYNFSAGVGPDGSVITAAGGTDTDGNTIATYTFTFPADVTRIRVRVQGAGGGSGTGDGGGGGGAYVEAVIDGSEGDSWLVWVGESVEEGLGTPARSGMSRFYFTAFKYAKCAGGFAGTTGVGGNGGVVDVAGIPNYIGINGGAGVAVIGGGAGCGAPSAASAVFGGGMGAMPEGTLGGDGFVVVDYWKN